MCASTQAITACLLATLKQGDHAVLPSAVYGGTHEFADEYAPRFGIEVTHVDATNIDAYKAAMRDNTRYWRGVDKVLRALLMSDFPPICS